MKLVEKKARMAPEFGDKVKVLANGRCSDLHVGDVGVVAIAYDSDGEVKVYTEKDYDYFRPEQLEVLSKLTGESVESTETITVEMTESELDILKRSLGEVSFQGSYELYNQADEILQEVTA